MAPTKKKKFHSFQVTRNFRIVIYLALVSFLPYKIARCHVVIMYFMEI